MKQVIIAVIDGQGGGLGKALVKALRSALPGVHIRALGVNSAATSAMLSAGAADGVTGESAVVFHAPRVSLIIGPVGIIMPYGLSGEISPRIAEAIGASPAEKILLPAGQCGVCLAIEKPASIKQSISCCIRQVEYCLGQHNAPPLRADRGE